MIPLRVFLKNFLCHREQEFVFDGHPVWLLHGPNGVGKSAVFDAMAYALFADACAGRVPPPVTGRDGKAALAGVLAAYAAAASQAAVSVRQFSRDGSAPGPGPGGGQAGGMPAAG